MAEQDRYLPATTERAGQKKAGPENVTVFVDRRSTFAPEHPSKTVGNDLPVHTDVPKVPTWAKGSHGLSHKLHGES
jgi:hypothetical protein